MARFTDRPKWIATGPFAARWAGNTDPRIKSYVAQRLHVDCPDLVRDVREASPGALREVLRRYNLDADWLETHFWLWLDFDQPEISPHAHDLDAYRTDMRGLTSGAPTVAEGFPRPVDHIGPGWDFVTTDWEVFKAEAERAFSRYLVVYRKAVVADARAAGHQWLAASGEIKRDVGWLLDHRCKNKGFPEIAKAAGVSLDAVRVAIHGIERRIGLQSISEQGRPKGRKDAIRRVRGTPKKPKAKR